MEFALLLSLFISFTAFAESEKCIDTFQEGLNHFNNADNQVKLANENGIKANRESNHYEKCHLIFLSKLSLQIALNFVNEGRLSTQNAIYHCKETASKDAIIKNLNRAFEYHQEIKDSLAAIDTFQTELGCTKH